MLETLLMYQIQQVKLKICDNRLRFVVQRYQGALEKCVGLGIWWRQPNKVWIEENQTTGPGMQYVCNQYSLEKWMNRVENHWIFRISQFCQGFYQIISSCYIVLCDNLRCTSPSTSEKNKSIMASNHYLWKTKDIFHSASFILCFLLIRGVKTSWKVPTLNAAFCFSHITCKK